WAATSSGRVNFLPVLGSEPWEGARSKRREAAAGYGENEAPRRLSPRPARPEVLRQVLHQGGFFAGLNLGAERHHAVHGFRPPGGVLGVMAEGVEAVAGATTGQHQLPHGGIGLGGHGSR